MPEIEITIDSEGSTEIDLKGYHGKGCAEITDKLVKSLQGEVVNRSPKTEYYKTQPKTKVKQQQRF
jgi:hypothetical protein